MKLIALLTAAIQLINRLMDRFDDYKYQRKQQQQSQRRATVRAEPDQAFANLFGKPTTIQLHKPITRNAVNDNLRADLSTIVVDKNGDRSGNNT